jgi:hypothetical protein
MSSATLPPRSDLTKTRDRLVKQRDREWLEALAAWGVLAAVLAAAILGPFALGLVFRWLFTG